MEKYFDIKIYPKSKSKKQCLGPCYHSKTNIIHPTLLEIVSNTEPFCPVDPWKHVNPETGEEITFATDICFQPTEKKNISSKELELNMLTPFLDFNSGQFLKIYYEIFSFEDSIDWIERNKYESINTRSRIINSSLITYGDNVELFDNRFVEFIIEFIKKRKVSQIYDKIHNYIGINESIIMLEKNDIDKKEKCIERINYILQIFITKEEITKFLIKYFSYKKDKWSNIKNHMDSITINLTEYILNKIILGLQK
jgi:hypothetical protein